MVPEEGIAVSENLHIHIRCSRPREAEDRDALLGKIYTRDDLVRAILGQQWAVAVACMMSSKPKPPYLTAVLANPTLFPSPDDIVTALENA
jgi:CDP-diacylglycerol pyrophosphatase